MLYWLDGAAHRCSITQSPYTTSMDFNAMLSFRISAQPAPSPINSAFLHHSVWTQLHLTSPHSKRYHTFSYPLNHPWINNVNAIINSMMSNGADVILAPDWRTQLNNFGGKRAKTDLLTPRFGLRSR